MWNATAVTRHVRCPSEKQLQFAGSVGTCGTVTHLFGPLLLCLMLAACGGGGGGDTQSTQGNTPPLLPTVSLVSNPTSIANGASSMLTWSSTNARSCTSSGAWGVVAKAASGSESTGTLTASTNYSLTCTGSGGTASASATVIVSPPPI